MKKLITILLGLSLFPLIGCSKKEEVKAQAEPKAQSVEPVTPEKPSEEKPSEEKPIEEPPVVPQKPSRVFMEGYWDGYYGNWLGPIRWVVADDYRHGRSLGAYDRRHGIDRYPKEQR